MTEVSYGSLVEMLLDQANHRPEQVNIYFIANDGTEKAVTAGEIYGRALAYADLFAARKVTGGNPVIIALPHTMDVIYAFWGALYLGAIPSIFPYSLPRPNKATFISHVLEIVQNSKARVVLAAAEYEDDLTLSLRDLQCDFLAFDEPVMSNDEMNLVESWENPDLGQQIAYLQYTSGTTGVKKGVALSHASIFNFIAAFGEALKIGDDDVVVNWTPLYHDGGLFFGMLMPMFYNIPTVLMSSFKWVRNPGFFLKTIEKYQGTLAWMPNSGFSHTSLRVRERDLENLDLSSMRFLLNGSEPILHSTRVDFLKRFAGYGFRATALGTGYGLAENTLAVTVSRPDEEVPVRWISLKEMQKNKRALKAEPGSLGSVSLVSSGRIIESTELKIVDDQGQNLPDCYIGEIVIRGNSVYSGYYRRPELSLKTMLDGWLLTGDTGYLENGWLYVCGRKKDIIIVGARNIHPEDIESLAATIKELYPDRVAVFGVMDEKRGTERIILVADLKRGVSEEEAVESERVLRQLIYREMDLALDAIHLFQKGWIVKTANGKMSRSANRKKYLQELGEKYEPA